MPLIVSATAHNEGRFQLPSSQACPHTQELERLYQKYRSVTQSRIQNYIADAIIVSVRFWKQGRRRLLKSLYQSLMTTTSELGMPEEAAQLIRLYAIYSTLYDLHEDFFIGDDHLAHLPYQYEPLVYGRIAHRPSTNRNGTNNDFLMQNFAVWQLGQPDILFGTDDSVAVELAADRWLDAAKIGQAFPCHHIYFEYRVGVRTLIERRVALRDFETKMEKLY